MSDHLPPEIVEEILHRLPAKPLVKFTSVCKAWNSLITYQTFISDHLNRTINQASNANTSLHYQFFRLPLQDHFPIKDFYSLYSSVNQQNFSVKRFPLSHLLRRDRNGWILFVGTCNGLVCSAKNGLWSDDLPSDSGTIVIWNPLLRKCVVLPKPIMACNKRKRFSYQICYGFGFDSRNNDYKVIRLMLNYREQHKQVDVCSLVSRSWRSVPVGSVPQFEFCYWYHCLPPMFFNGVVHWLVSRPGDNSAPKFILSFDVIEETFAELMLSQYLSESPLLSFVGVEGGHSLAVVSKRYSNRNRQLHVFSVWVMKEYGIVDSWTEIFRSKANGYGGILSILAVTITGKVVLNLFGGAIVLVDPITQFVEHVGTSYVL